MVRLKSGFTTRLVLQFSIRDLDQVQTKLSLYTVLLNTVSGIYTQHLKFNSKLIQTHLKDKFCLNNAVWIQFSFDEQNVSQDSRENVKPKKVLFQSQSSVYYMPQIV